MRFLITTSVLLTFFLDASAQRRGAFVSGRVGVVSPSPPSTQARPPVRGWRQSSTSAVEAGGGFILYPAPYPVYTDSGSNTDVQDVQDKHQEAPPSSMTTIAPQQSAPPCEAPSPPRRVEVRNNLATFFIALKDGWVYTSISYWVQDETLHYVTAQGEHNQVSLHLVDRQTSAKLNEGRGWELLLPPLR
jgi:hypothetical protein